MRAPCILGILLFAVAAGCLGPPPDSDIPDPTDADPLDTRRVVAATNVVVEPEGEGGEPMLGVTPDGTLFTYSWPPDPTSWISVYRSVDGGATWESVGARPLEETSGDPDLTVDVDGTVWFDALIRGCTFVAVSQDAGESWTVNEKVCLGAAYDRPRIVPAEGGRAYLYHDNGYGSTSVLGTSDHGGTWTPVPAVAEWSAQAPLTRPGWGGGGFWNPATGSVFFTYTVREGPPSPLLGLTYAPGFGVLRDDGGTFDVQTVPGVSWSSGDSIGGGVVDGAADDAGNIYLTWAESIDGEVQIRLAVSSDDGATWSGPIPVDEPGGTAIFPTVAAGAEGHVAIAYYETGAAGAPQSVSEDAFWNVTLAWTADALTDEPAFEYGNLSHRAIKQGPICPGGLVSCGDGNGDRALLEFFDIQALPDGRVAGVWSSTREGGTAEEAVNVFGSTDESLLAPGTTG